MDKNGADESAAAPRRPRGLKKSFQLQKEKSSMGQPQDIDNENLAQIVLEEGGDEVDEICYLLKMGMVDLYENQDNASMLFRAVIHECDRLLRMRAQDSALEKLPARFYRVYGVALFYHSQISKSISSSMQSAREYLSLSMEYLSEALDKSADGSEERALYLFDIARVEIVLAHFDYESDMEASALKHISKACQCISQSVDSGVFDREQLLAVSGEIVTLGEHCGNDMCLDGALEWFGKLEISKGVSQDDSLFASFLHAFSVCLLAKANCVLEMDGDDCESIAYALFERALVKLQRLLDTEGQVEVDKSEQFMMLCECHLQMGNISVDEEQALEHHQAALKLYDEGKSINTEMFPQDFEEIIEELRLEVPMDGGAPGMR